MPPEHERNVIYTYRYLRAAMIALLIMLVFSAGYQWWWETNHTCWLGSISAYYYTPARTIFVGSLCALGACLIAYKGHSREEDLLLNFSGFMAFVVAIVPTVPDDLCGINAYSQSLSEIEAAVRNNVWSLLVVTVLAAAVRLIFRWRLPRDKRSMPARRMVVAVVLVLVVCVVIGELLLFFFSRGHFIAISHGVAAVTMVSGVIAVMLLSALQTEKRHQGRGTEKATDQSDGRLGEPEGPLHEALDIKTMLSSPPRRYKAIYMIIAAVLTLTLFATVIVWRATGFDRFILWVELLVIVLFGIYWVVQTVELRNVGDPTTPEAPVGDDWRGRGVTEERRHPEPGQPVHSTEYLIASAQLQGAVEGREADTTAG